MVLANVSIEELGVYLGARTRLNILSEDLAVTPGETAASSTRPGVSQMEVVFMWMFIRG